MIQLIVDGQNVDLYDDETIGIDVSLKSVRSADTSTASYTNTFLVPATENNNLVFDFYYNPDRVINQAQGDRDYRYRVPAAIEIDSVPFKSGYIILFEGVFKDHHIENYQLNFTSYDVTLFSLLGNYNIKQLDWSNHNYDENTNDDESRNGMDGSNAGTGNHPVIFPLIQSEYDNAVGKWDSTGLSNRSYNYKLLKPAFQIREILDMLIEEFPNLSFSTGFIDQDHFKKIYMYCPYKYKEDTEAPQEDYQYKFATWNPEPGYSDSIINLTTSVFNVQLAQQEVGRHTSMQFTINTGPATSYTVREYASTDGVNYSLDRSIAITEPSGGSNPAEFLYNQDNPTNYAYYKIFTLDEELTVSGTYEVWGADKNQNPTYDILQGDGTMKSLNVTDPNHDFVVRVPSMTITDMFKSLVNMFNLMIYSFDGLHYVIEDYDTWRQGGSTVNISDNADATMHRKQTPQIPKKINFHYYETEAIANTGFFNSQGKRYGDMVTNNETIGGELDYPCEAFSCPLWENIGNNMMLFSGYTPDFDSIQNESFLMYWGGEQACETGFEIDFGGWDNGQITSYKVCSTFYPYDTPTHSLAFDNEQSSWDNNLYNVGLFDNYYLNWFNITLSIETRAVFVNCYKLNITAGEFDLKDTIKLGNRYYLIDNYKADLINDKVQLHLMTIPETVTYPLPELVDTVPPEIGILSIVHNPDVTPPTAPSNLTYDTVTDVAFTLYWDASVDDISGISYYKILFGGLNVKQVDSSMLSTTMDGLTTNNTYNVTVTAVDHAGNESTPSNQVDITTTDSGLPVMTTNPGYTWQVPLSGATHNLQLTATKSPDYFEAQPGTLPSFCTLNQSTGMVTGVLEQSDNGDYDCYFRASNDGGVTWGEYKYLNIFVQPI